jgi:magnesium-transporting ATPase (P-type)
VSTPTQLLWINLVSDIFPELALALQPGESDVLLHAFSTRSEKNNIFDSEKASPNPYLPVSVVGGIALTVLMQMVPTTRRWLGSGSMPVFDWVVATVGAIGPLLANEMVKAARFAPVRLAAPPAPAPLTIAAE